MLQKTLTKIFGSKHEHDLKSMLPLLGKINELEGWAMSLTKEECKAQTERFKERLARGETLDNLLPEAYALTREASRRVLGERPYDVQLLGSIVLHRGKIMEMKTGEGKTLSSVSAAYLNALTGKGVHIITVNDYLAERDAGWMGPVYEYLGLTVGCILSGMDNDQRKESYAKDITYGTNNEFGFDYLRDNMRWTLDGRVQRGHHYTIIDEIDSILIDEARTPLIISGQAEDDTAKFNDVNRLISQLVECSKDPETGDYPEDPEGDYKVDEKSKRITFTEEGMNHIEAILQRAKVISGSLYTDENFEYIHYFTQALKAHCLFHRDVDYVIEDGLVQIVDEFTGRILHGRRYSEGLHQAIEAKEHIKVARRNRTLATITFQNYFRMYQKISGMTGTADTEAKEFNSIYGLDVVVIPTNRPVIRRDEDDVIYLTETFKFDAICDEIARVHAAGQPILVGTVSIEKSEKLSHMLTKKGIRHEVLNAKNHHREAMIIAEAGAAGSVTIATNMAGRGTDIKLGGNPEYRARRKVGTEGSEEDFLKALEKEREIWTAEYQRVQEAGGLYILGTERHESRRIDNQLRGRSGRQGDPGTSRFFLSLDDDLMRLFARDNIKNLMGRIGMSGGEPLFHPWINKAIERAQTRVEERNFEIRKHLLEYDDVLNEQRNFIYSQRDAILAEGDLSVRILETAKDLVADYIDEFARQRGSGDPTVFQTLAEHLRNDFFIQWDPEDADGLQKKPSEELLEMLEQELQSNLEEKRSILDTENLTNFIRYEYLRNIDTRWQDHLDNLEALREAVYLRAYGQKNPLLEYKLEGFDIFDKMIYDIKTNIAKKIIKVRFVSPESAGRRRGRALSVTNESHREVGQFALAGAVPAARAASGGESAAAQPEKVQVRRTTPKVGRNDPCPCGSGKKYKYCCGR
ncbi:MAG: preprotein translocase subunit SecA [Spirochaetales bacterium]|nr:preprotein translocase subunit SecA [Spirochaetales bacterium]